MVPSLDFLPGVNGKRTKSEIAVERFSTICARTSERHGGSWRHKAKKSRATKVIARRGCHPPKSQRRLRSARVASPRLLLPRARRRRPRPTTSRPMSQPNLRGAQSRRRRPAPTPRTQTRGFLRCFHSCPPPFPRVCCFVDKDEQR